MNLTPPTAGLANGACRRDMPGVNYSRASILRRPFSNTELEVSRRRPSRQTARVSRFSAGPNLIRWGEGGRLFPGFWRPMVELGMGSLSEVGNAAERLGWLRIEGWQSPIRHWCCVIRRDTDG